MKWWDQMPWSYLFLMLSFKPAFSLSSFTLIKRFFSSSSLYPIRVVSYAYLRLLIFLSAVLIPACDSSSPAFHMVFSAYKLGSSVHSVLQARILKWVVIPFSRRSSYLGIKLGSPPLQAESLLLEPWGKPLANYANDEHLFWRIHVSRNVRYISRTRWLGLSL